MGSKTRLLPIWKPWETFFISISLHLLILAEGPECEKLSYSKTCHVAYRYNANFKLITYLEPVCCLDARKGQFFTF